MKYASTVVTSGYLAVCAHGWTSGWGITDQVSHAVFTPAGTTTDR